MYHATAGNDEEKDCKHRTTISKRTVDRMICATETLMSTIYDNTDSEHLRQSGVRSVHT